VSVAVVAEAEDASGVKMTEEEATGTRDHRRPEHETTDTEVHHQHAALTVTLQAAHTETIAHVAVLPHPTADHVPAPPLRHLVAGAATPQAPVLALRQGKHAERATIGLPRVTET